MSEPNIQVPAALIAMALEIDKWFKQQGYDTYCLGPICSRDYANACEAVLSAAEPDCESHTAHLCRQCLTMALSLISKASKTL